jgi:hypothetical protein
MNLQNLLFWKFRAVDDYLPVLKPNAHSNLTEAHVLPWFMQPRNRLLGNFVVQGLQTNKNKLEKSDFFMLQRKV